MEIIYVPDNRLLLMTDEFTLIRAVDVKLICFTLVLFGFRRITFFKELRDMSVV